MLPLQIKRRTTANVDPKQLLRAHVEQLPVEKQREFVESALQLLAQRSKSGRTTSTANRQLMN